MGNSVCAVVVTYNRKNLLVECLDALRKQTRPVQGICLIDNNSQDGTPEILLEKGYIEELPPRSLSEPWEKEFKISNLVNGNVIRIHYIRMNENTGSSGGYYEGVKRGYEKGYDWLWLMDDDSEPKEDALESLSLYFDRSDVVALGGKVILQNGDILYSLRAKLLPFFLVLALTPKDYQKELVEIDIIAFEGLLVRREAVREIGYPKKELFIYCDDIEYCARLRSIGKLLLIPKSVMVHKGKVNPNLPKSFVISYIKKFMPFDRLWLDYYPKRNFVWIGRKYSKSKLFRLLFYILVMSAFIVEIIKIVLLGDHKWKRIKLLCSSFIDGFKGNFDNEKPKRILYGNK